MRTIDITTTQKVAINYELAPLMDRVFAFVIDFLVMTVGISVIVLIVSLLFLDEVSEESEIYIYALVVVPIFGFYTLLMEIFNEGQSLGKKAMGIKVVKLNGAEAKVEDYLIRWVFRSIDIYLSSGGLAAILISTSSKSQRLGDLLSSTAVIKLNPSRVFNLRDIEKLDSIENYEPKYEGIRAFSEEDMLLIKTVIERARRFNNPAHRKALKETAQRAANKLGLAPADIPKNRLEFLRSLIKDYIVLTR